MTTITYAIKRQIVKTADSPRRLVVVALLLTIIAASGLMTLIEHAPRAIEYYNPRPVATPGALCPGEKFTYAVSIDIKRGNSVSRVTEGWCQIEGICPKAFQAEPIYYNFVAPYSVHDITTTRTVPPDLPPGDWEFRHCNETHSDATIEVICYAVDVTVKDSCQAP